MPTEEPSEQPTEEPSADPRQDILFFLVFKITANDFQNYHGEFKITAEVCGDLPSI